MNEAKMDDIKVMIAVVLLSLIPAVILFGLLKSTGVFKNPSMEFGGPAAGYFAALILLMTYYLTMHKRRSQYTDMINLFLGMFSQQIVNDSEKDVVALNQGYSEFAKSLRISFKGQGKKWVDELIEKLTELTKAASWGVPELRSWIPHEKDNDLVIPSRNR